MTSIKKYDEEEKHKQEQDAMTNARAEACRKRNADMQKFFDEFNREKNQLFIEIEEYDKEYSKF